MIGRRERDLSGSPSFFRRTALALPSLLLATLTVACDDASSADEGPTVLTVWRHDGTDAESEVFSAQVADFMTTHPDIRVDVRTIPEGDYNDELQAGAAGRTLPDVVEVDGPLVDSYVYQGQLAPLDGLLAPEVLQSQLPSLQTQGQIGEHTYAVGVFDSGLGLYADRRRLRAAGVTSWPTSPQDAWSATEFADVLRRLAAHDRDGRVLDVKLDYGVGEWLTYGFAPLVASAGGALIDPTTLSPVGHLDGTATRVALSELASWSDYIDPDTDGDAFVRRDVALSWVGHWVYPDYAAALGHDLLVLPLPDLGHGTKSGQGSWTWSITAGSPHDAAAATFLDYLLEPDQVLRMSEANGAVPGTTEALARSELYGANGPLRLFAEDLLASCRTGPPTRDCVAVPRPATPGYPTLSAQFAAAVSAALTGGDWESTLTSGTRRVVADLEANGGYGS